MTQISNVMRLVQVCVIYFLVLLFILFLQVNIFAETDAKIKMPEGFEDLYIGMSISEVIKIRPDVQSMYRPDWKLLDTTIDTTIDQHLLEYLINNPTFSKGMYAIKNQKLQGIALWTVRDLKTIKKHRKDFISNCIDTWGRVYKKKVVIMEHSKVKYSAPTFIWDFKDKVITATTTPDFKDVMPLDGIFMVRIFSKEKYRFEDTFKEETVSKEKFKYLFKSVGINP